MFEGTHSAPNEKHQTPCRAFVTAAAKAGDAKARCVFCADLAALKLAPCVNNAVAYT